MSIVKSVERGREGRGGEEKGGEEKGRSGSLAGLLERCVRQTGMKPEVASMVLCSAGK